MNQSVNQFNQISISGLKHIINHTHACAHTHIVLTAILHVSLDLPVARWFTIYSYAIVCCRLPSDVILSFSTQLCWIFFGWSLISLTAVCNLHAGVISLHAAICKTKIRCGGEKLKRRWFKIMKKIGCILLELLIPCHSHTSSPVLVICYSVRLLFVSTI